MKPRNIIFNDTAPQTEAIALGFAMAALGNLLGLVEPTRRPPYYWSPSGILLWAGSLLHVLWPTVDGVGSHRQAHSEVCGRLSDAGLTQHNLKRSLAAGVLVGLAMGAPSLVLLVLPDDVLPAVQGTRRMRLMPAVRFTFGQLLLSTAVSEELAFRGVLQQKLRATFRPRDAILLSSLFFALWHGVFNARTLIAMGVTSKLGFGLASVLQMVSVYVGGVAFGTLREWWGNLAGNIVAHWLADIMLNARFLIAPGTRAAAGVEWMDGASAGAVD